MISEHLWSHCYPSENVRFHFSLATFKIFSFSWVQHVDHDVMRNGFIWIYPVWCLLNFLNLHMHVFHQIWGVFRHFSLNSFSAPFLLSFPLGILVLYVRPFEIVPHGMTQFFVPYLAPPPSSSWLISSSSLILSSVISILQSSPSSEFSIFR